MAVSTFILPLLLLFAHSATAGSSVVKPGAGVRRADLTNLGTSYTWGSLSGSEFTAAGNTFASIFDADAVSPPALLPVAQLNDNSNTATDVSDIEWKTGLMGLLEATTNLGIYETVTTNDLDATNVWATTVPEVGGVVGYVVSGWGTTQVVKLQHLMGSGSALGAGALGQAGTGASADVDMRPLNDALVATSGTTYWLTCYYHWMKVTYSPTSDQSYSTEYGKQNVATEGSGDCANGGSSFTSAATHLIRIRRAVYHHDTARVYYASLDCHAYGFGDAVYASSNSGTGSAATQGFISLNHDGTAVATSGGIATWKLQDVQSIAISPNFISDSLLQFKIYVSGDSFVAIGNYRSNTNTAWATTTMFGTAPEILDFGMSATTVIAAATKVNAHDADGTTSAQTYAKFSATSVAITYDQWTLFATAWEAGANPIAGILAIDIEWKWVSWVCPHDSVSALGDGLGAECKFLLPTDMHRIQNEDIVSADDSQDVSKIQVSVLKFTVVERSKFRRMHCMKNTDTMSITESIGKFTITEIDDDATTTGETTQITLSDFTSSSLLAAYIDTVGEIDDSTAGTASSAITAFAILCVTALLA